MKHIKGSTRVLGMGALTALLAAVACSDDPLAPPMGASGSAGSSSGSPTGGSSSGNGTGGNGAGTGGNGAGTGGTSAGMSQGGMVAGGEGGVAGEGGLSEAGAAGALAGEGGMAPAAAGAGGADLGGAGTGGSGSDEIACDYQELEADSAQDTGLVASGAASVICGKLEPGQFDTPSKRVDRDGYRIDIDAPSDVLIRVDVPGAAALTKIEITLDGITSTFSTSQAVLRRRLPFDFSPFSLTIRGFADADIAQALPYQLSVTIDDVDTRCPASAATASYVEGNDGPDNRGNDVYETGSFTAALTAATDAAEPSGITLAGAPASYRIDGTSGTVTGQHEDGDTYAFKTGADARQLTVRADWAGAGKNMDLWLFKAGETVELANATYNGTDSGEYLTTLVEPNTDYALFAATPNGTVPNAYSLTLCGESFSLDGK
jgi:hypothetical protein